MRRGPGCPFRRTTSTVSQRAAERAAELASLQERFLESVEHELRTPTTTILGVAELLERGDEQITETVKQDLVGRLAVDSRRLVQLLEDLFEVRRPVPGRPSRSGGPELVEVGPIVAGAIVDLGDEEHQVHLDAQPAAAAVIADDVTRITRCLVDNAVRYTRQVRTSG